MNFRERKEGIGGYKESGSAHELLQRERWVTLVVSEWEQGNHTWMTSKRRGVLMASGRKKTGTVRERRV
jgi:hypothetical protein